MFCLFHDDEVVACDKGIRQIPNDFSLEARKYAHELLSKGFGTTYTRVLYRCKRCGRPKSRTVDGHWTIEQIRGEAATRKEA